MPRSDIVNSLSPKELDRLELQESRTAAPDSCDPGNDSEPNYPGPSLGTHPRDELTGRPFL
ncbi:MAG: hypothetical protein KAT44_11625, partial [Pirellulales bacterium]|nr:hypothetical protein [Pirellulales bacterium]